MNTSELLPHNIMIDEYAKDSSSFFPAELWIHYVLKRSSSRHSSGKQYYVDGIQNKLNSEYELVQMWKTIQSQEDENSNSFNDRLVYATYKHKVHPIFVFVNNDNSRKNCNLTLIFPSELEFSTDEEIQNILNFKFVEEFEVPLPKEPKNSPGSFYILIKDRGNLDFRRKNIELPESCYEDNYLDLNYGSGFEEKYHSYLINKLKNNSSGLYLLHGSPGTGKTTYIKLLSKLLKDTRDFLFVPAGSANLLSSPDLGPVLLQLDKPIIVLEDAEKAIKERSEDNTDESLVASLLNLADGILGSVLSTSIICTFNIGRTKIDSALLRKGRLKFEHFFDNLNIDDSKRLLDHLGHKDAVVESPMSLAEIYNYGDDFEFKTGCKEVEKTKQFVGI